MRDSVEKYPYRKKIRRRVSSTLSLKEKDSTYSYNDVDGLLVKEGGSQFRSGGHRVSGATLRGLLCVRAAGGLWGQVKLWCVIH